MKQLHRLLVSLVVPAFMLAGLAANPAIAQDKAKAAPAAKAEKGKPVTKVLVENDKVLVTEVTFKPGDEGASVARGYRVVRYLTGGTQQFTYADGKTEKFERKAGGVAAREADKQASKIKNVGKTTLVVYVVNIKGAK